MSDLSYDRNDLLIKNIFKQEFSFDKDWFNFISFNKKHVTESYKTKKGIKNNVFNDQEEVQHYITEVWKKDPTLRKSNITVGTIHSVKGGEADHVVLYSKANYPSNFKSKSKEEKTNEKKVWYTATTRARKTIHLLDTNCKYSYPIGGDYLTYVQER